jgi:cytosine/adenosine deaminase-related metal-dependent hydrolase
MRVVSAPWLFTGSDARGEAQVLADGAVALDGDHVVAVGPRAEVEARHGAAERLDAVILPALVNAHTHLELSHLQDRITGGEGLVPWVGLLVAARTHAADPGPALAEAILELEEAGVAAVGEITNGLGTLSALRRAGLAGTVFHEVYGFTPESIAASLERADAALAAAGDPGPGLAIRRSPHAVYSTEPGTVARLLAAGRASIHLAEDPAERAFTAHGAGPFAALHATFGTPPTAPFARSAVAAAAPHLGPESLAVHCVDLDEEDVAALAASGATVVLCPRSNLHISEPPGALPDLPRLLAAGIPLAVGTDSLASSPSLSPLAELAALARAFPGIPAARLLPIAWNGAAVGAPSVGRLAPGTAPGVLAAPLFRDERGDAALEAAWRADPARWLLHAFGPSERPFQWIARHRPGGPAAGAGAPA